MIDIMPLLNIIQSMLKCNRKKLHKIFTRLNCPAFGIATCTVLCAFNLIRLNFPTIMPFFFFFFTGRNIFFLRWLVLHACFFFPRNNGDIFQFFFFYT